jgi:undecaprenyl-diphosphatase
MNFIHFPDWDTELFLYLNGLHFDWLDPVMTTFSSIKFWIPMYVLVAGLIVWKKRWESVAILAVLILSIAITDQLSVHLFKNVFERLRPCHLNEIKNSAHFLENCGGLYGFVSSHAANAFCFAMFLTMCLRNNYCSIIIFFWAALVSYSRIYVGKHFPLDVICGAAFGVVCQQTVWQIYRLLKKQSLRKLQKNK